MNRSRRFAVASILMTVALGVTWCPTTLRAETVIPLWAHPTDNVTSRADVVVVDSERAYLSGRLDDANDTSLFTSVHTLALDRTTGLGVWSNQDFPAAFPPLGGFYESASLFAGRLAAAGALVKLLPPNEVGPAQAFVKLWEAPTGKPLCTFRGGDHSFFDAVAVSTARLVVGGFDGGPFDEHVRGLDLHCSPIWTDDFTAAGLSPSQTQALAVATSIPIQFNPFLLGNRQPARVSGTADRTVVAGLNTSGNGQEVWMVRGYRTLTGAVLWTNSVPGPSTPNIQPSNEASAVATSGQRAFVAGRLRPSPVPPGSFGLPVATLRAYNVNSGAVLWTAKDPHAGYKYSEYYAVAASPTVVVAVGRAAVRDVGALGGDDDWLIKAHDVATGAVLWSKVLDFPDHNGQLHTGTDCARSVAIAGGYVIVVGNTDTSGIAYTPAACPGGQQLPFDSRFHVRIYRLTDGHLIFSETVSQVISDHLVSTGEATSAAGFRRSSVEVEFQVAGRLGFRAFTKAYRVTNP